MGRVSTASSAVLMTALVPSWSVKQIWQHRTIERRIPPETHAAFYCFVARACSHHECQAIAEIDRSQFRGAESPVPC